mgnify:CR=1 FL=1
MDPEPSHPAPLSRGGLLRAGLRAGLLGGALGLLCLAGGGPLLAWNALVMTALALIPATPLELGALQGPPRARRVLGLTLLCACVAFVGLSGGLVQAIYLERRWEVQGGVLDSLGAGLAEVGQADALTVIALPAWILAVAVTVGLVVRVLSHLLERASGADAAAKLTLARLLQGVALGSLSLLALGGLISPTYVPGFFVLGFAGGVAGVCLAAYYFLVDRIAELIEASWEPTP